MTQLEATAQRWIAQVHPHPTHLVSTRDWVLVLDERAGPALRIAAVLHDVERAFPDPDSGWDGGLDWDRPEYLEWHQRRCAEIATGWLREQGAPSELCVEVERLIRVHEEGGSPDENILQAADSLSFLEMMAPVTVAWLHRGVPLERAAGKLAWMAHRIQVPAARDRANALLALALADVLEVARGMAGRNG